jgi:hypothetical protein
MEVFCGIDWAEDHHDIALAGRDGQLLARRRISDDAAGLATGILLSGLPDTAGRRLTCWPGGQRARCRTGPGHF